MVKYQSFCTATFMCMNVAVRLVVDGQIELWHNLQNEKAMKRTSKSAEGVVSEPGEV